MNSQENLTTSRRILLLGTGGTIAGLGGVAYKAAQLPVAALLPQTQHSVVSEQLAQIDSKNMDFTVWKRLYTRIHAALRDDAISAIVMTHGTDTMEETAFFLYRMLQANKPVVLTGAMRPADAPDADGAQNLTDALAFAATGKMGVWLSFAGQVFSAGNVQKVHPTRLNAFDSNTAQDLPHLALRHPIQGWPRVDIVMSYAGASGELVEALIAQKVDGIVVAGTGNGTMSDALKASLHKACEAGIAVGLTTRCLQGYVLKNASHTFNVLPLSPVQARVELMLRLMSQ